MPAYSFLDTTVAISGPNGSFTIAGPDTGSAEEGVDIDYVAESDSMLAGADGTTAHSLNAGKQATWTIRLIKTSPINAQLEEMYTSDRAGGSAQWGKNVLSLKNSVSGDSYTGKQSAFRKFPRNTYSGKVSVMEWTFNSGVTDPTLGDLTIQ